MRGPVIASELRQIALSVYRGMYAASRVLFGSIGRCNPRMCGACNLHPRPRVVLRFHHRTRGMASSASNWHSDAPSSLSSTIPNVLGPTAMVTAHSCRPNDRALSPTVIAERLEAFDFVDDPDKSKDFMLNHCSDRIGSWIEEIIGKLEEARKRAYMSCLPFRTDNCPLDNWSGLDAASLLDSALADTLKMRQELGESFLYSLPKDTAARLLS